MHSGPKSGHWDALKPIRYRIRDGVKPYAGRLLYPEHEEEDQVGGRIKGVTAERWYRREELERLI
jgi:hypothetical protein